MYFYEYVRRVAACIARCTIYAYVLWEDTPTHTHIYIYIYIYILIHTNIYKYIPKLYPQTWSAKDYVTKFVLGADA